MNIKKEKEKVIRLLIDTANAVIKEDVAALIESMGKLKIDSRFSSPLENFAKEIIVSTIVKYMQEKGIEVLVAYIERQKEQQPAEWSDEDEKMKQRILTHLYSFIYPNSLYEEDARECISWLKSIRPQQKQEWTEEDIKTWKNIVYYVLKEWNGIGQYLDNPLLEEIAKELQKRYGSVKTLNWKPSEEQGS